VGGRVLAPADCFGCRATWNSFSLVWVNPPFDESYGGHRVEQRFLQRATDWLMPGGVMALVCPEDVVGEGSDTRRHFSTYFEDCMIVPFPAQYRPFSEVVVFGHKRARPTLDEKGSASWQSVQAPERFVYHIPPGNGPKVFEKTEPTEPELQRMLAESPLRSHLKAPVATAVPSPPLALAIGHVALLLASGHLDGVVQPDGKQPHVVRGTSRKREYVADVSETDESDGGTKTTTTIKECIELMVRTVDLTGEIRTFLDSDAKEQ
jgi:hypothetical protein